MATQVKRSAAGNAPATGMQKSNLPDDVSTIRSPTGQGYGMNGPHNNGSSVPPGQTCVIAVGREPLVERR